MRSIGVVILTLMICAAALAEEPTPAEAFLNKARAKYQDWTQQGLNSFSARVLLRSVPDPEADKHKEIATFDYAWTAPDKDEYSFRPEAPQKTQQGIQQGLGRIYTDLTGLLFFGLLEKAGDLALVESETESVLTGRTDAYGEVRVSFDPTTLKILVLAAPKHALRIEYGLTEEAGRFRIASRAAWLQAKKVLDVRYFAFRKVDVFEFPTRLEANFSGKPYRFAVEYSSVNGRPARMEDLDPKEVKAQIAETEKGWAELPDAEKLERLKTLAEYDHDLASLSVARLGLSDPSPAVREGTAKVLGLMRRTNVTPVLLSAMDANEKYITTYLALIWALGEISDPRAVKALSSEWWNQRIGEHGVAAARAKIQALGKIKHVSAVDALVDTLYITKDDTIKEFKADLVSSLAKLTGQNFGYDRKLWKDWWKKNRSRHRFP